MKDNGTLFGPKNYYYWTTGWRKFVNPTFWDHPTPMNVVLLFSMLGGGVWTIVWFVWFLRYMLPWPTL
jgi:hypothetical protein